MSIVTEAGQEGAEALGHDEKVTRLAWGKYSLPPTGGQSDRVNAWDVKVVVYQHFISRRVRHHGKPWPAVEQHAPSGEQHAPSGEQHAPSSKHKAWEVIWPTWPETLAEEMAASASPLKDLQEHWDVAIGRLRDSAKWISAVLGAALASVIPTAPLTGLGKGPTSTATAVLGVTGLLFLSITMVLILQVMRPQSLSYTEIQDAHAPDGSDIQSADGSHGGLYRRICKFIRNHALESPLYRWKQTIEAHPDLYLPCGVKSLEMLHQSMTVEELTLIALSRARETAKGEAAQTNLDHAQAARAARLYELRCAAATIVSVGEYYTARARSTLATYGGAIFGFLGLVTILAAVAWPIH
jgi:hypothetical protein